MGDEGQSLRQQVGRGVSHTADLFPRPGQSFWLGFTVFVCERLSVGRSERVSAQARETARTNERTV